jgi:alpha-glucosidase (family GH31 glycosyl hydrolase)
MCTFTLLTFALCGHFATASPAASPAFPELQDYNPVANSDAVVVSGNARFTVLTDRAIRMEYVVAPGSANENTTSVIFQDNATTAILNRNLPVPKFTQSITNGILTIATQSTTIQYTVGHVFSDTSLSAKGDFGTWTFGQASPGNLLGTIKSLDQLGPTSLNCTVNKNISVHGEDLHCAWGLISRDGWSVVDDGSTWLLDSDMWWTVKNTNAHDLYLFAHGLDFKGALNDFVQLSGKTAMPPRATFGLWWTRWFNYNAADVRDIVQEYIDHHLPLDVFVLDMDWHVKPAWGAYTWDNHLFPDPKDAMLSFMKQHKGLITLANIHDDNGVVKSEAQHAAMVEMMHLPSNTGDIPFEICTNQEYAKALEDAVLLPIEQDGIDYWWIDWQQGGNHGGCQGMLQNPTIWTNKIRATDHLRRADDTKRGLVLARWGGLGSHRYQVGFSGDVAGVTWENLAYQPYFSMTSTNVAYGFWSHDIVGSGGESVEKLELYTRWLQWATYSGVFRSHDRGSSAGSCAGDFPPSTTSNTCTVVKPWNVPLKYFKANRAALQRRAAMVPYTYTLAREAYDTGLGPLRPMYYEYPTLDAAYGADMKGKQGQYFYGDDLLVSPITVPASNTSNYLSKMTWWVPPGNWVEENSHDVLTGKSDGSTYVDRLYALDEIPVLVRAGAIIPTLPSTIGDTIGVAGRQYDALVYTIYPGSNNGSSTVYEDDGATTNYHTKQQFARTTTTYSRGSSSSMSVAVTTIGMYPELPTERSSTELRIIGGGLIKSISLNGKDMGMQYARYSSNVNTWTYCHKEIATVIRLPSSSIAQTQTYDILFEEGTSQLDLSGVRGMTKRGSKAKAELDLVRTTPGAHKSGFGQLDMLALFGDTLARFAGTNVQSWIQAVSNKEEMKTNAVKEVQNMKDTSARNAYVNGLLE